MTDTSAHVIVAGSVNVDFIVGVERLPVAGETVDGHRFTQQGGGKSANQGVAASRMGAQVALLGAVGDDDLGRTALRGLVDEGVGTGACRIVEGEHTGLALIVVDDLGENQIAVAPGANARVDRAMVELGVESLRPADDAVCLVTLEFGDDAVLAVIDWARRHGLRLILNPAPARMLSDAMLDAAAILTPNLTEATSLTGASDPAVAASLLSERTGAPVIVSLGGDGAVLADGETVTRHPAMVVETVDTTGAGDALNGILAAELSHGTTLPEALRWAMAGAALSTTGAGAQAGLPRRDAVASLLERR